MQNINIMKKPIVCLITIVLMLRAINSFSAGTDYYMTTDQIVTCSGTFYDSQGPDNNYKDVEDYIVTFLPASPGKVLEFNFTSFNPEFEINCIYDYPEIYDGINTSAPLTGKYCGPVSPETVTATNEEGALTFVFHSDEGVNASGWVAAIELKGIGTGTVFINMYNMTGKLLFARKIENIPSFFSRKVMGERYPKGIYMIEIISGEKTMTKKIVLK